MGDEHGYRSEDYDGWDGLKDQLIKDYSPASILPVYLYDHSGLTVSTEPFSCPWDSGQVGFILISKEKALEVSLRQKMSKKLQEWSERYLKASLEEYDQYLRGDIYGYVIKDEDDNELDSCWGFYGIETAIEEAEYALDISTKTC